MLSQFTDQSGRRTLRDYIPLANIYSAGRLDYRSEGLLLLTDNGELIKRLTDPQYKHPKTYFVQVEGDADFKAVSRLSEEIVAPAVQTRPVSAEIIPTPDLPFRPVRSYHPTTWIRIVLNEGKKHQVRRMTAAVGYPTLRLVRVAIGKIELENMLQGEWRYLSVTEIMQLRALE